MCMRSGPPSGVPYATAAIGNNCYISSCPAKPGHVIECAMNTEKALETLRRSESALRARGVRRAALFGSVARGENRPESDIDIMIEVDPEAHITVFDYVGIKEYIASLFDAPVDVVSRESLKAHIRPAATA